MYLRCVQSRMPVYWSWPKDLPGYLLAYRKPDHKCFSIKIHQIRRNVTLITCSDKTVISYREYHKSCISMLRISGHFWEVCVTTAVKLIGFVPGVFDTDALIRSRCFRYWRLHKSRIGRTRVHEINAPWNWEPFGCHLKQQALLMQHITMCYNIYMLHVLYMPNTCFLYVIKFVMFSVIHVLAYYI
jgi:hypothetical protein